MAAEMMIFDTVPSSFLFRKGNYLQRDCLSFIERQSQNFSALFSSRSCFFQFPAHGHIEEHPFPGLVDS
jgi:hypothetical protein